MLAEKQELNKVSTHSRLKAAGIILLLKPRFKQVSTHSRLKAAGLNFTAALNNLAVFQHTAA